MSKKAWIALCVLEALIIGFLIGLQLKPQTPVKPDVVIKEIVRDSIIRDSIFIEIEKIKREIVYVEKQHTKDSTDIMSASDSVLLNSFSKYIDDYNNK